MVKALEINKLAFAYPPRSLGEKPLPLFEDVSFSLDAGEILALIGPNGSGKTTLLNCAAGLLKPNAGNISLFGRGLASLSSNERARLLAYLPQEQAQNFSFSVLDYLLFGRAPYLPFAASPGEEDYERAKNTLKKFGMENLRNAPIDRISGGELRQAQIGRVLMQEAKLILMDEPATHLDYGNKKKLIKTLTALAEQGYAILFTTHDPADAVALGCKVCSLGRDGAFKSGNAAEMTSEKFLDELYEIDA